MSILVASRLPCALLLEHPIDASHKVKIQGLNKSMIIGAPYNTTDVDADFWELWLSLHADYAPIKNGSIFAAKNANELAAMFKEIENRTGFEPMQTDGKDPRAKGVKKESTDDYSRF